MTKSKKKSLGVMGLRILEELNHALDGEEIGGLSITNNSGKIIFSVAKPSKKKTKSLKK